MLLSLGRRIRDGSAPAVSPQVCRLPQHRHRRLPLSASLFSAWHATTKVERMEFYFKILGSGSSCSGDGRGRGEDEDQEWFLCLYSISPSYADWSSWADWVFFTFDGICLGVGAGGEEKEAATLSIFHIPVLAFAVFILFLDLKMAFL
ncbi:putative magnesium transporter NIPA9 isoform X3 [Senna tora]|uniref:Putative magnesium transporter NIPA9 isoform X3 n=1 Tax=Senna tora TaxID=362788 RepID=A0A835CK74_9FABA|nr:putative magnesium transporter NIPA9 isoform X3 [Senna tora]